MEKINQTIKENVKHTKSIFVSFGLLNVYVSLGLYTLYCLLAHSLGEDEITTAIDFVVQLNPYWFDKLT